MKNKKKILVFVIAIVFMIIVGIVSYPYIKVYVISTKTLDTLKNEDYEYCLSYRLQGLDYEIGNELLEGEIVGEKSDDVVRGSIQIDNKEYLEVYGNKDGEVVFNAGPLIKMALNQTKDSFETKALKYMLGDIYVTLEQITDITGNPDVGDTKKIETFSLLYLKDNIKPIDKPEEINDKYLKDATFFSFYAKGRKIIVGVPKEKGKLYLSTDFEGVRLIVNATYKVKDMDKIDMPESDISDSMISVLKDLYESYK